MRIQRLAPRARSTLPPRSSIRTTAVVRDSARVITSPTATGLAALSTRRPLTRTKPEVTSLPPGSGFSRTREPEPLVEPLPVVPHPRSDPRVAAAVRVIGHRDVITACCPSRFRAGPSASRAWRTANPDRAACRAGPPAGSARHRGGRNGDRGEALRSSGRPVVSRAGRSAGRPSPAAARWSARSGPPSRCGRSCLGPRSPSARSPAARPPGGRSPGGSRPAGGLPEGAPPARTALAPFAAAAPVPRMPALVVTSPLAPHLDGLRLGRGGRRLIGIGRFRGPIRRGRSGLRRDERRMGARRPFGGPDRYTRHKASRFDRRLARSAPVPSPRPRPKHRGPRWAPIPIGGVDGNVGGGRLIGLNRAFAGRPAVADRNLRRGCRVVHPISGRVGPAPCRGRARDRDVSGGVRGRLRVRSLSDRGRRRRRGWNGGTVMAGPTRRSET